MIRALILFLFTALTSTAFAQQEYAKELEVLKKLAKVYAQPGPLSFELKFTYAPESKPGQYTDSLHGEIRMMGNRYWYQMDSTISVNTGKLQITVYPDQQLLYVTKPQTGFTIQGIGIEESVMHTLDSLAAIKQITLKLTEDKQEQKLQISFSNNKPYKMLTYHINRKTGLLTRCQTIVNADMLRVADSGDNNGFPDKFGIVDARFLNYSNAPFNTGLLDAAKYVLKESGEYIGAGIYKDYKVFLGSPDL